MTLIFMVITIFMAHFPTEMFVIVGSIILRFHCNYTDYVEVF